MEITIRPTLETLSFLPPRHRKNTVALANRLTAAMAFVQPAFPAKEIVAKARDMELLAERLEALRPRLYTAPPDDSGDADLAAPIRCAHEEINQCLDQMGAALTTCEILIPIWLGTNPTVLPGLIHTASETARASVQTDPAGLPFALGLLLIVTQAVAPPSDEILAELLKQAETQGLLPTDRRIGLPDYTGRAVSKNTAEINDKRRLQLNHTVAQQFKDAAEIFGWTGNELANQLLQITATHPPAAGTLTEYRLRARVIEDLMEFIMTARGTTDEAALARWTTKAGSAHETLLAECEVRARDLADRASRQLYPVAGATWAYAPEFLAALDPLLPAVRKLLPADETPLPPEVNSMLNYLRLLKILP